MLDDEISLHTPTVPSASTYRQQDDTGKADTQDEASYERRTRAPVELVELNWPNLTRSYPTAIMYYHDVEPVAQRGKPQCGVAAAAMAASIVRNPTPNVGEMTDWARDNGLTNNGDLFDIRNLKTICDQYVGVPSTVIEFPDKDAMIADLIEGSCFLVPYDTGNDRGRPAMNNGHSAHYAIVSGVVLMRPESAGSFPGLRKLSADKEIYLGDRWSCSFLGNYSKDAFNTDHGAEFLLALHGWYAEPHIWSFQELYASCMQLNEVDPYWAKEYLLPPGGIVEGLRGKVLKLEFQSRLSD